MLYDDHNLNLRYAAKGDLRRGIAMLAEAAGGALCWLSDRERFAYEDIRDLSRRDEWLLGRWLVKRMVAEKSHASRDGFKQFQHIELLPNTFAGRPSRPLLVVDDEATSCNVSLSHGEGGVLAAIATNCETLVGVDLVKQRSMGIGFLKLWFTAAEQQWLQSRPDLAVLAWGAKEATYKALQQGEGFVPSQFEVHATSDNSWRCFYKARATQLLIYLRCIAPQTWAIVACNSLNEPDTFTNLGNARSRETSL